MKVCQSGIRPQNSTNISSFFLLFDGGKGRSEMEKFYGDKGEIGWGNQIRSYVFQPYQMVKDLRIGVENGNVQAVMDGDLDGFIHNWLRAGKPRTRNKDIQMEDT